MPGTAPTNRPAKGTAKPRKWKTARDEARAASQSKKVRVPRSPSALQIAQAEDRSAARAATKAQRRARLKELEELRTRAVQAGLVEHGINPINVLQRLIDDAFMQYVMAQQDYDNWIADHPELDNKIDTRNPKLVELRRLENRVRAYRREAAYFSGLSVQYNLQERQTQVAEARIQLFMHALQQTLRHPDIDLTPDKVKLIPGIMKQKINDLRDSKGTT